MTTPPIRVAAVYRFAAVSDPDSLRTRLEALCGDDVLGTLLVAREGVNGTIAGPDPAIERVLAGLRAVPGFADLEVKTSTAATPPFHRLKVRVKSEIVTMGQPGIDPVLDAGTYVAAAEWNALIADPDTVVIDTRNDYEADVGAFAGAIQPRTRTFREFADWFEREGRAMLDRPGGDERGPPRVAMYCTGGIRCEKATAYLKAQGVADVHHLQGGILRYLETVPEGESLWQGECFVFDERVAVGHNLAQGTHSLCRGCRMPVSEAGRASLAFVEGVCCDRCHDTMTEGQRAGARERDRQVRLAAERGEAHIGTRQALPGVER
ncbi:rhodanese-related sulfurtransferase [Brevundimonas subvibrioides]|uniref:tRNA uridine(34) hydroxylase n=1 Tax=Brevundimonas subvibrioides (strain ATCC 15264 / DSM 4735 / LMG 14903 / NBRC 16000 / CB 81) TaxID=633149 RepID=D9QJ54_BRESC|nr:rhodanese-related sulfurtransferase [Brevundimonas subvibrioides]ADK99578.1 Rhodanese domain protein [Brevundimonas subvibrioides ATCC 15264]